MDVVVRPVYIVNHTMLAILGVVYISRERFLWCTLNILGDITTTMDDGIESCYRERSQSEDAES